MNNKSKYAIFGLFIAAFVDLTINLLAAAIQQQTFLNTFTNMSIVLFFLLSAIGLLIGYWLGIEVKVPVKVKSSKNGKTKSVTMTRLKAFFSYITVQGSGIQLKDIFIIGSKININSRSKK